jgi:serine/threonine protein kinase
VKVLDFGLAKAMEPATAPSPSAAMSPTIPTPAMTRIGTILGTAAYISPDQAKGRPADKRSDVWAVGVVLYEMLTGRRAFDAEDVSDTLAAVLRSDVDWSVLPPALPPVLRAFLIRCLERDPRQRVPDIAAIRLAIDGAFDSADVQPDLDRQPASTPADSMTEILESALDTCVSPARILGRHPNGEALNRFHDPATARGSPRMGPLLGNKLPMPTKDRIGSDERSNFSEDVSSDGLALDSKPAALGVGQPESSTTELLFKDSVLLPEEFDNRILMVSDPAGQGGNENLPRLNDGGHPLIVACGRSTRTAIPSSPGWAILPRNLFDGESGQRRLVDDPPGKFDPAISLGR